MAGEPSDLGSHQEGGITSGIVQGRGPTARPSPQGPWEVSGGCHKVQGGSDLGEKDFCGVRWEQKPDLLWVEKSVGGEEVQKAT